ncbi:hypothetical protein IV203_012672 [Nitzschia inconspicua]|uniref:Uncharacterized protein n=1 Tax=Nitzschia inconspicua TaxID=303405 RepID=A0A9K3K4I9_9STRA|nr:hypothetical protein IV203_014259 [Nitzschia inconspicua]KAG7350075.1 hypothetical protein IV203_012672 [Nitzschia inconspicua]
MVCNSYRNNSDRGSLYPSESLSSRALPESPEQDSLRSHFDRSRRLNGTEARDIHRPSNRMVQTSLAVFSLPQISLSWEVSLRPTVIDILDAAIGIVHTEIGLGDTHQLPKQDDSVTRDQSQ